MWPLIRKDLLRRRARPASTLVMVAFPLFMSLALGSVIGGGGDGPEITTISILVENRDEDGFLSRALVGALSSPQSEGYLEATIVGAEGRELMEMGKASALLIIPVGFTAAILDGTAAELRIVRNPSEGIKPEIVVQGAELVAAWLDQGSRLLGGELGQLRGMIEGGKIPPAARVGALAGAVTERMAAADGILFPPVVGIGSAKEATDEDDGRLSAKGIFGYVLLMTSVMALLFVAVRSVTDLFEEQNSGMLRRQFTSPQPVWRIMTAKFLFSLTLGLVVMTILAIFGLALGWLEVPEHPLAAILLGVTFNLAACSLVALIVGLSRNEKQAGILSWLIVMGMSAMGGSMVPLQQLPAGMRAVSDFTLNFWVIDGLTRVMFESAGLGEVGRNLAVLTVAGLVLAVAADALLVRRFREVGA